MTCDLDVRDPAANILTPEREAELRAEATRLSGAADLVRVEIGAFDRATGNPSKVSVAGTGPAEDPVRRALGLLEHLGRVLGLAPDQAPELVADPNPLETTGGATAVHVHQRYKGIPIFQARTTVRFQAGQRDHLAAEILTTTVTVGGDRSVSTPVPADRAVLRAAQEVLRGGADGAVAETDAYGQPIPPVGGNLGSFEPRVVSGPSGEPERTTVFDAGPFAAPVKARLAWFYLAPELRLAWRVDLFLRERPHPVEVLVDAATGQALYCRPWG